jgi:hypothetical protein
MMPMPARPSCAIPAALALTLAALLRACDRAPAPTAAEEKPSTEWTAVTLPGGTFEPGDAGWNFSSAQGFAASVSKAAAHTGEGGLRLEGRGDDTKASASSPRVKVDGALSYRLTFRGRVTEGAGTGVYLRFLDPDGRELQRDGASVGTDRGNAWTDYRIIAVPPVDAATVEVVIQRPGHRPPGYAVELDDFELRTKPFVAEAPWPGSYKLRPAEQSRLTAADVLGPDGLVYPDWRFAGVPGGIPEIPVKVRLVNLGALPGADISALIEQAAGQVAATGGGAIEIGEGEFHLDAPVMISADNVVIRGAGRDRTRLVFRYHIPRSEVRFFRLADGQEVRQNSTIEFHANPKNLVGLELKSGNTTLAQRTRADHWGNTFSLRVGGNAALDKLGEGVHEFTATARYEDGSTAAASIRLKLVRSWTGEVFPSQLGAINFTGQGTVSDRIPLAADVARGDRVIRLRERHGFQAGDTINLVAPASDRWKNLVGHTARWQIQAQNMHRIEAVDGAQLTLNQPVRTAFLVEDGSYAAKIGVIRNGGVESLTIEQPEVPGQGQPGPRIGHTLWHAIEDLWTNGINMEHAWGCWVRDVTVRKAGRNAAYFLSSKHVEIRDCLFDDAIFKGGGGTGYVGFDRTYDSLMDTVETRGMRHAPNVQWNSSGNVIRNGRFLGSDGQWHAGWTLENLYENNFIDARGNGGSYGHGLYASGPSSGSHGPQGPRNVVYHNDVRARRDGLHMLGGNEAWMILHNRFVIDDGRAVYAKEKSFDHIILGNVFILKKPALPPVLLGADSVGVELVDNTFFGVTPPLVGFAGGKTALLVDEGNTSQPGVPQELPPLPSPPVPSIFAWQREQAAARAGAGPSP